jgi:hypothetical protein
MAAGGALREWEREQVARISGHAMLVPTLQERVIRLRLALTQARDALERHRDPLVREIDRVLGA